jgi:CPA2 family monovalent cation:H+ antiporter-2
VLSVGVAALGLAYSATYFGLSVALGAFVAGIVVGESDLSHQILGEILPMRDIFAGLFFVSVGMLVDPGFVIRNIPLLLLTIFLIIVVKGVASTLIALWMKTPVRTAVLTGALLAVCAEFSFLLARLGRDVGAEGNTVFNLMLAGSAVSIMLAPAAYRISKPIAAALDARFPPEDMGVLMVPDADPHPAMRGHAVICGYGDVGRVIGEVLARHGFKFMVVEEDTRIARRAVADGIPAVIGNAAVPAVLEQTNPGRARVLVIAIPDPIATRTLVDYVRDRYPRLDVVVRTHSEEERRDLLNRGVRTVILGEWELALEMTRHALHRFGVGALIAEQTIQGLRARVELDTPEDTLDEPYRDRQSFEMELRRQIGERRAEDRAEEPRSVQAKPAETEEPPREPRKPRIKNVRPSG